MNKSGVCSSNCQGLAGISTTMAMKEVVVSALQALTSDEFERSSLVDNSALEVLVMEYFGRRSDDKEIRMFINNKIPTITVLFVGP